MMKPPFKSRLRARRLRRERAAKCAAVLLLFGSIAAFHFAYAATVNINTVEYTAPPVVIATSTAPVVIPPPVKKKITPSTLPSKVAESGKSETSLPHELAGIVSAYSASPEETDDTPNITANGDTVYVGGIACPSTLKFGTKVLVSGKKYVCNDRMNPRYEDGRHFDIFSSSKAAAVRYGRQQLTVTVLE